MSYICLLVNENGAVAAGDTRISMYSIFPFIHAHHDHGRKVFMSKNRKTIWATDGLTRKEFLHFPTMVKKIMEQDEVPIEERVKRVEVLMSRHTRKSRIPFLPPNNIFNMIYCDLGPDGKLRSGDICVKEGALFASKNYKPPTFSEDGMNMRRLSASAAFVPGRKASLPDLHQLAVKRVQESIDKDKELRKADRHYLATIGGKVLTVSLAVPSPLAELKSQKGKS